MDTKGKRGSNWTIDEEILLIEQSKLKDEELFGKMKGCGDVKATIRQSAWQAIADILNAFTIKKRTWEEVKNKFYNLKQRSKEKDDLQRRHKTGGGPPPVFSAAEEIMVGQLMCGNKAELTGLPSGLDTDVSIVSDVCEGDFLTRQQRDFDFYNDMVAGTGVTDTMPMDDLPGPSSNVERQNNKSGKKSKESRKRNLNDLEVKNIKLDNKRLKFEIMKLQQEREKLAVETSFNLRKKLHHLQDSGRISPIFGYCFIFAQ